MRRFLILAVAVLLTALAGSGVVSDAQAAPAACKQLAPTHLRLALSKQRSSEAMLKWRTGRAARGVTYRVIRDGKVVGQTTKRSMRVRVSLGRSYRFSVRPVVGGHPSRACGATEKLTVTTAPPAAPTRLTATDVTSTAVTLSWRPSRGARGVIRGYRVLRDGVTVRQVRGTRTRIESLFPARDYTFSVAAVDSVGRLSAPARVQTRTADPAPSQGDAHAFLLASTSQSFRDFQAHYQKIGTVYPTYYDCNTSTAALIGKDDPQITAFAQQRHVAILPRINCQRTAILHRILTEPALRQQWLDGITALVDQYGYDGAALDFEAGAWQDRDAYTSFVADLASRMHARGKRVTVAASAKLKEVPRHPRSSFFDYPGLSQAADHVFVMAWGIHWATSAPGAQDDMSWVQQVVAYIDQMPNRQKFVLGMQLYAMDWADNPAPGEQAQAYEWHEAQARLAAAGGNVVYDPAQDALHFTYAGPDGRTRMVWYTDATTQANRIALARAHGLGVGFWRLGNEDQRLWDNPQLPGGAG